MGVYIPNRDEQGNPISETRNRFEREDIVLKLAKTNGQADANGDLVIDMAIPGIPGEITRYAAGGYAYTENYSWLDCLVKCEVVDADNIFGYGAGAVLKNYHDQDVAEENQGWYFEKSYGNEGNLDIEPMGWYGAFRGGLVLRLTFKVQANSRVKTIIWWGTVE